MVNYNGVVFVVCTSDILNQNFFILNIHYYFAEAFREQKSPLVHIIINKVGGQI